MALVKSEIYFLEKRITNSFLSCLNTLKLFQIIWYQQILHVEASCIQHITYFYWLIKQLEYLDQIEKGRLLLNGTLLSANQNEFSYHL